MNKMESQKIFLQRVQRHLLRGCWLKKCVIEPEFANELVIMFARDRRLGIDWPNFNSCKVAQFYKDLWHHYVNPTDAIINSMRISFYMRNFQYLDLAKVREKQEERKRGKLSVMINDVLQYPATSRGRQLEEMLYKMQVFIAANYSLGDPRNHVLLNQIKDGLKSVLGPQDLRDYLRKRKIHRLEYLDRLGGTVCGILVYTNLCSDGNEAQMRDLRKELKDALASTKSLLTALEQKYSDLKLRGLNVTQSALVLDIREEELLCYWPMEKLREISRYVTFYTLCERACKRLLATYERSEFLIGQDLGKLECVIDKIDEVLKLRTAVLAERIFPHFVYLSELWQTLVIHYNHLTEMNTVRDYVEHKANAAIEQKYLELLERTERARSAVVNPVKHDFDTLLQATIKTQEGVDLTAMKTDLDEFCCLTLVLTNGLLVKSNLSRKMSDKLKIKCGFAHNDFRKYSERRIDVFLPALLSAAFSSVELIMLCDLHCPVMALMAVQPAPMKEEQSKDFNAQTELVVENDLSARNKLYYTWNKWDFHRETIRLANLRRCQTHSTQSDLSFGRRDAQLQAYNRRSS